MTLPQLDLQNAKGPKATIKTELGDITLQLFPEQAPKTVENFIKLAEAGYYDGIIFHRVIPDFMIQGGDPTGTGAGGESAFGGEFADEFSDELFNLDGALSMANAGPDTNGSQFFIVQNEHVDDGSLRQIQAAGYPAEIVAAYRAGGTPWLDGKHTVFGQVIKGKDVVKNIGKVKTNRADKPKKDITMQITIADN